MKEPIEGNYFKINYISELFLKKALELVKKYENGAIDRSEMAWGIVNLAINLGLFELISENKLPEDIVGIVNLACDLEVPDESYEGDIQKDVQKLVSLIKQKAKE